MFIFKRLKKMQQLDCELKVKFDYKKLRIRSRVKDDLR